MLRLAANEVGIFHVPASLTSLAAKRKSRHDKESVSLRR